MKYIGDLVNQIDEELEGAKRYAEEYLHNKVNNNTMWSNRYKEMAQDELRHSGFVHEKAVEEINKLKSAYTPPQSMLEKWEKSHANYVEKAAWIKQMLSM